jgi:hypothetical protein
LGERNLLLSASQRHRDHLWAIREGLAIEVDFNLPAPRIVRTLDRIAAERGYPRKLRLDELEQHVILFSPIQSQLP